jgi:hypothetical protein
VFVCCRPTGASGSSFRCFTATSGFLDKSRKILHGRRHKVRQIHMLACVEFEFYPRITSSLNYAHRWIFLLSVRQANAKEKKCERMSSSSQPANIHFPITFRFSPTKQMKIDLLSVESVCSFVLARLVLMQIQPALLRLRATFCIASKPEKSINP